MESVGVKEVQEVKSFLLALSKGLIESKKDGKIDLADASHFMPALMSIPSAIEGLGKIPAEIKDLSSEELAQLLSGVSADLGLQDEKLGVYVEEGVKVLISVLKIVKA